MMRRRASRMKTTHTYKSITNQAKREVSGYKDNDRERLRIMTIDPT